MMAGGSQCKLPVVRASLVPGTRKPLPLRHTEGGRDHPDIRSEVRAVARSHEW